MKGQLATRSLFSWLPGTAAAAADGASVLHCGGWLLLSCLSRELSDAAEGLTASSGELQEGEPESPEACCAAHQAAVRLTRQQHTKPEQKTTWLWASWLVVKSAGQMCQPMHQLPLKGHNAKPAYHSHRTMLPSRAHQQS